MNLQDLPTKRKELIFYKIQQYNKYYWKELPRIYHCIKFARLEAQKKENTRIVKRTEKGWEIV